MSAHSKIEIHDRLSKLAKQVYACHRTIIQIDNNPVFSKEKSLLVSEMENAAREFESLGGVIGTGLDHLNMPGPILRYPNNEVINYDIGHIESEQILSGFKKS